MSTLPPLPEWSLRDDLGELVPSEIRVALRAYATAALSAQAAELEALRADAERYRWLRDGCDDKLSEATRIAADCYGMEWDAAIDAARAALKEQTPNTRLSGPQRPAQEVEHGTE